MEDLKSLNVFATRITQVLGVLGVNIAQMSQNLCDGKFGEIFQLQSEKVLVIMLLPTMTWLF